MYGNSENEIERCVRFRRGWSISSQNTFLSTFLLTNQREILRYRVIHQKVINPSCIKIMFSLLFFSLEVKKTGAPCHSEFFFIRVSNFTTSLHSDRNGTRD